MKLFFDVLLYIDCLVLFLLLIKELIRFPVRVEKIDLQRNRKNKPLERYMENSYCPTCFFFGKDTEKV